MMVDNPLNKGRLFPGGVVALRGEVSLDSDDFMTSAAWLASYP